MDIYEAHEFINDFNFDHPGAYEVMHEALDELNEPGVLSFEVEEEKCTICGFIQLELHAVPMKYPCECGNCGQMSCYKKENNVKN